MLFHRCRNFIKENNLINKNDTVIIASSGGGDSTFLLFLFESIRKKYDLTLKAVYIDHKIRRRIEIENEIRLLRENCKRANIELEIIPIEGINKKNEEELRNRRYEILQSEAKRSNALIATGHTSDDQIETFFLRLFRGCGLHGIGGIPVRRENIIRPVLNISKSEIRNWLKAKNVHSSLDSTNLQTIYDRNKLRINVLPKIRDNFPDASNRILEFMKIAHNDNIFIENMSSELIDKYLKVNIHGYGFLIENVKGLNRSVLSRFLIQCFEKIHGTREKLATNHIELMMDVMGDEKQITQVQLPGNIRFERERELIIIYYIPLKNIDFNFIISEKSEITIPVTGENISFEFIENYGNDLEEEYVEYFDADKIELPLTIRNRMNGDRIIPLGLTGSKKIKKVMGEKRIVKIHRDYVPIITDSNNVIIAVGRFLRSSKALVTDETENILKISFRGNIDIV